MSAEEALDPMDALRLASDTGSLGEVRSQLGMLVLGVARGDPPVVFGANRRPQAALVGLERYISVVGTERGAAILARPGIRIAEAQRRLREIAQLMASPSTDGEPWVQPLRRRDLTAQAALIPAWHYVSIAAELKHGWRLGALGRRSASQRCEDEPEVDVIEGSPILKHIQDAARRIECIPGSGLIAGFHQAVANQLRVVAEAHLPVRAPWEPGTIICCNHELDGDRTLLWPCDDVDAAARVANAIRAVAPSPGEPFVESPRLLW
jgi:hypothetical protein